MRIWVSQYIQQSQKASDLSSLKDFRKLHIRFDFHGDLYAQGRQSVRVPVASRGVEDRCRCLSELTIAIVCDVKIQFGLDVLRLLRHF